MPFQSSLDNLQQISEQLKAEGKTPRVMVLKSAKPSRAHLHADRIRG